MRAQSQWAFGMPLSDVPADLLQRTRPTGVSRLGKEVRAGVQLHISAVVTVQAVAADNVWAWIEALCSLLGILAGSPDSGLPWDVQPDLLYC